MSAGVVRAGIHRTPATPPIGTTRPATRPARLPGRRAHAPAPTPPSTPAQQAPWPTAAPPWHAARPQSPDHEQAYLPTRRNLFTSARRLGSAAAHDEAAALVWRATRRSPATCSLMSPPSAEAAITQAGVCAARAMHPSRALTCEDAGYGRAGRKDARPMAGSGHRRAACCRRIICSASPECRRVVLVSKKHKTSGKDKEMTATTATAIRTAGTTWDSRSRTAGTTWDGYSRTAGTTWD
ncbi:hypothetical protein Sme01_65600 [Sphaerisporangium melleum]|uniref:Uncharacterized protein n=1 Tax=Sphaerisporangium melleum TaxID=321316 RepID=A0A917RG13_9ACTN|nr:hypothetical protein GCM10007964_53680 [Sphaerisporangium melleum]GII74084.1 hypothetical protein Sme01_65600 [Sphaerisporangium melleum]